MPPLFKAYYLIMFCTMYCLCSEGKVRITYCVVYETIVNALPKFKELAKRYFSKNGSCYTKTKNI